VKHLWKSVCIRVKKAFAGTETCLKALVQGRRLYDIDSWVMLRMTTGGARQTTRLSLSVA